MIYDDIVLVNRTLQGEQDAFEALVRKYQDAIYGLAFHLIGDFTEAQDIAQQTFIKAYLGLSQLKEQGKFAHWLKKITVNECTSWLRRQQSISQLYERMDTPRNPVPTPEQECEKKELNAAVRRAMESLSEKNRLAVTLYYIDGLSQKEVANFLGVSVDVVANRISRARKQLKEKMMEMVEGTFKENELPDDFAEKVQKAIEQAQKSQSQYVYREVITFCDEALDALTKLDDSVEYKRMKKDVLELKGNAVKRSLTRREATKYYEEVLELEIEIGDKLNQAHATKEMGRHYLNIHNKEKASEYYQRALDMFTELGDKTGQAEILYWLGSISLLERKVAEGISFYQRALDMFTEIDNKKGEAASLAGINFLKRFGKQRVEEDQSKMFFKGAVCETFDKLPDALVYLGLSGILDSIRGEQPKDTFFDSGPFRWLPDMMKLLDFSLSAGDSWSMNVPSGGGEPMKITVTIQSDSESVTVPAGEFENCLKTKIVTSEEPKDCDFKVPGVREIRAMPLCFSSAAIRIAPQPQSVRRKTTNERLSHETFGLRPP
ncbi:sigma-70 family RNA polymerase sigma factor, partial [Candidatus Poribacteria bacterium]|nr:sigma-70 family RNA polymerase sigma factor [Candidatus Poribacteria bacterium]